MHFLKPVTQDSLWCWVTIWCLLIMYISHSSKKFIKRIFPTKSAWSSTMLKLHLHSVYMILEPLSVKGAHFYQISIFGGKSFHSSTKSNKMFSLLIFTCIIIPSCFFKSPWTCSVWFWSTLTMLDSR